VLAVCIERQAAWLMDEFWWVTGSILDCKTLGLWDSENLGRESVGRQVAGSV